MSQQEDWTRIQNIEGVIRGSRRNTTCLFSGCEERPISSHVVARKTMELIADESHVLAWLPHTITAWDIMRSTREGRFVEQLYEEPIGVGIRDPNRVTEPLFCNRHDNIIFAPLDHEDFSFQPYQVALLAYRALCSMVFSMASTETLLIGVMRQQDHHDYLRSLQTLQRFQESQLMLQVRQLYEQIQATNNYDQLGWAMYLVNIAPCIAATYAFILVENNEELAAATDILAAVTLEDAICFSFLPYEPQESSVCVISWLKGSQRAQRFLLEKRINEIAEKEQQEVLLSIAFESPTIYISPLWWQSLNSDIREKYKRIRSDAYRRHNYLG